MITRFKRVLFFCFDECNMYSYAYAYNWQQYVQVFFAEYRHGYKQCGPQKSNGYDLGPGRDARFFAVMRNITVQIPAFLKKKKKTAAACGKAQSR